MIAGNGVYPETFARAARRASVSALVAAAFVDETNPALEAEVDALEWFRVGQLSKMIKFFKGHAVTHAVMVGQIAPKNLFDLRPDLRTLVMLGKLKERNAESIFGAIGDELGREGITLISATTFLDDHLPAAGPVFGPAPDAKRMRDARFGFRIAKEVSRLDIGQTVVVKRGTVLAVEAFEGTDQAIARGGAHGHGGATVVKVSKPDQDFRFDVPVVGPETVRAAADAGVDGIVVEAGCTLLLGRDEIAEICRDRGVFLYAMAPVEGAEPYEP
ncbi:UDP-2,3-diacylglucosamine diphosphatase LpxI [soil metagenome]